MEPRTLEELVKEVGISLDQLEQRCSDGHLKHISLFLDCNWRIISPHLGLSRRNIEDIESEKRTESEKRLTALQKWKTVCGFRATLKSLVVGLLSVQDADDAKKVCRLLQSQAGKHETLEENIEEEIQNLEDQFLNIVNKAANHLETIRLLDLQRCVTQLPVSVKYQHIRFLQGNLSAINKSKSVNELVSILSLYWDFLNCGLLNEIVCRLGNDETKRLMEKYTKKLREFRRKTKLGDYIGKQVQSIPPHFTQFTTEMGGNWRERTLKDLKEFQFELARLMQVEEYALLCKRVKLGCSSVTWGLQSSLPRITDSLQSIHPLLKEKYDVLKVEFRGKHFPEPSDLPPPGGEAASNHWTGFFTEICGTENSPPTTTLTALLVLPIPLEEGQQDTQKDFDIVTKLLGAGVPHITEQILSYLDRQSLLGAEAVSTLWRAVVGEFPMWKNLIRQTVKSNRLWRNLFQRRGWNKYLHIPLSQQMLSHFYRHLYQSASRDICTLKANWRRGYYSVIKIETGSTRVLCLQYDDYKIVTGHDDHTIKIWDRHTLQVSKVLKGHTGSVWCLQYNEEVVISGSGDATVKVWDIQTGQIMNELLHHRNEVPSLKFTTKTLVTGSWDGTVAVWDFKSPTDITLRIVLKGHNSFVWAVDFSTTNIISGYGRPNPIIKVWDGFTGELVRTLHGHNNGVRCLQLRGRHLISGSWDKTIRIWNIDSGKCMRVLHGHQSNVYCVTMDDKRIISGSHDRTVKVWDLAAALDSNSSNDDICTTTLKEHTAAIWTVSSDAFQLITGSNDGCLLIHDFLQLDTVTLSQ